MTHVELHQLPETPSPPDHTPGPFLGLAFKRHFRTKGRESALCILRVTEPTVSRTLDLSSEASPPVLPRGRDRCFYLLRIQKVWSSPGSGRLHVKCQVISWAGALIDVYPHSILCTQNNPKHTDRGVKLFGHLYGSRSKLRRFVRGAAEKQPRRPEACSSGREA